MPGGKRGLHFAGQGKGCSGKHTSYGGEKQKGDEKPILRTAETVAGEEEKEKIKKATTSKESCPAGRQPEWPPLYGFSGMARLYSFKRRRFESERLEKGRRREIQTWQILVEMTAYPCAQRSLWAVRMKKRWSLRQGTWWM